MKSVWETVWGLLVDDGQLAVGIVASLAIAWGVATYSAQPMRDAAGWLLLGLLVALVLGSLYRAGRSARTRP